MTSDTMWIHGVKQEQMSYKCLGKKVRNMFYLWQAQRKIIIIRQGQCVAMNPTVSRVNFLILARTEIFDFL